MKVIPGGQLQSHFSEVIEAIKKGEQIVISYEKKKNKIAVIVPFYRVLLNYILNQP